MGVDSEEIILRLHARGESVIYPILLFLCLSSASATVDHAFTSTQGCALSEVSSPICSSTSDAVVLGDDGEPAWYWPSLPQDQSAVFQISKGDVEESDCYLILFPMSK